MPLDFNGIRSLVVMLVIVVSPPPPTPLINLPSIRASTLGANAHTKQPTRNSTLANSNSARLPNISLIFPYRGWKVALDNRYDDAIHESLSRESNSALISPINVVIMVESTAARNILSDIEPTTTLVRVHDTGSPSATLLVHSKSV